jgi:hypothetical protein
MRACLALLSLVLALPLACQRLPGDEEDSGSGPSGNDDTTGFATLLPGASDDADAADEETGSSATCDPVGQTGCPMGQKCTAILSGGLVAYTCAAAPGGLGPDESCMASPSDGIDGCPSGYACLADEAGAGLCSSLCEGDGDCDQGVCLLARETDIPYCADDCLPFAASCPAPLQCRRNGNRFSCSFLAIDDVGSVGEPCAITDDAGCAPGLVCLPGGVIPDCTHDNCCTSVCDTADANPCIAPASCLPLLQGAAPGFESIGACYVPA